MRTNLKLLNVIAASNIKQFVLADRAKIDPTQFSKIVRGHIKPNARPSPTSWTRVFQIYLNKKENFLTPFMKKARVLVVALILWARSRQRFSRMMAYVLLRFLGRVGK